MVSRLHAKTNQIGQILHNLEKYNHMKEIIRSPPTPSSVPKSIFNKTSPTSPRGCPPGDDRGADYQQMGRSHDRIVENTRLFNKYHPQTNNGRSFNNQGSSNNGSKRAEVDSKQEALSDKESTKSDDTLEQSKCNGEVPVLSATTQEQSNA